MTVCEDKVCEATVEPCTTCDDIVPSFCGSGIVPVFLECNEERLMPQSKCLTTELYIGDCF